MNYQEGTDAVLDVFWQAWKPRITVWDDTPGSAPATDEIWARATLQHVTGRAISLADADGKKRYNRTGFLTVQVFAPMGDDSGAGLTAVQLVTNALQAANDQNVWFREVTMREAGRDGAFRQYNVTASFSYDDVR